MAFVVLARHPRVASSFLGSLLSGCIAVFNLQGFSQRTRQLLFLPVDPRKSVHGFFRMSSWLYSVAASFCFRDEHFTHRKLRLLHRIAEQMLQNRARKAMVSECYRTVFHIGPVEQM
ncbi:hypothetical protein KP509_12G060900 [Ceratopteris richardii]|uniref:Uncharacterized protein n=1 Tax=Ceratopteris richardii TaxID=49495 RepID=A0A8T2TJJ0_CERRI|nr:hypothetical protein KP509_12G060900 [Ceratopteris richardii]